ncbi:hypothetical protein DY000_02041141 [Brassica cretica]|uniref:Uncharacterized protein n=1 Tax=Brassica cretica TaxID=69181 RepID=A0ABQ7BIF4_BRACR|nr:hypothetical protein DY000_02041141 [Brassica cretica]
MPPPPARKEIVLSLRAPSVVPVAQPKGRKRKIAKGGDGESSQQGDSSIASGLRGKFMLLIDGMISECGSETSRLARELLDLQGRWSETEAMLTAVKDSHSVKVSKLEVAIGELERDLGKTASSLLKEKKARKAKSSEVRRLQRQIEGDAGFDDFGKVRRIERSLLQAPRKRILEKVSKSFAFNMSSSHGDKRSSDVEMGEATSPAPILTSSVRAGAEFPSSSALAIAPGHGTEVVTPRDTGTLAGSVVLDASALPNGSSMTLILVKDKERAVHSMPPPPARKEIVLALRAPSVVPVAQPKGRKRKFTKGGDGESSQQGDSSIASGLRGKFMSLIDGMISECGSETSRLVGELLELQGRWSETEAMLTAVKDYHSAKVSKLEVAIGELERDLGKTVSSLLKEKKARKAKSSEVRRLQRQIEGDAGLASRGIREANDSFQSETPPTLEAEEARLSGCKGDLAVVDEDFDLILADLKSACFLSTCSEGPEGKDPVLGEGGGDAAPGLDEATGEEGA